MPNKLLDMMYAPQDGGKLPPGVKRAVERAQTSKSVVPIPGIRQASEALQGFIGFDPRYSVMDPEAESLASAYRSGESASVISDLVGALSPFAYASAMSKASQIPGMAELIAYHGSPHKFKKFDASKIGTGEGAQAFGHGLYFAENPEVAKNYAFGLANKQAAKELTKLSKSPDIVDQAAAARVFYDDAGIKEFITAKNKNLSKNEIDKIVSSSAEKYQKLQSEISSFYKVDIPDEKIAQMLDWDKPISKQKNVMDALRSEAEARVKTKLLPEIINKIGSKGLPQKQSGDWMADLFGSGNTNIAINKRIDEQAAQELSKMDLSSLVSKEMDSMKPANMTWEMTGKQFYELMSKMQGSPERASAILKNQGVPGIRYFDEGSRGTGKGTSNFVVFPGEEESIKMLEINNAPPMKKGGAVRISNNPDTMLLEFMKAPRFQDGGALTPQEIERLNKLKRASQLTGYGEGPGMRAFQEMGDVGRGLLGAEAIIPGGEGYRTGQALANMPAVGLAAVPGKVASALPEVATGLGALGAAGVIKPKGGNWLAGLFSAEQALKPLKRTAGARGLPADQVLAEINATYTPEAMAGLSPESLAQVERAYAELKPAAAINKWIDTKLTKYVKNEMATPEDPVRALAERDILHFDTQNQDVPRSLGGYEEARMRLLKLKREGAKYPPEGLGKSNLAKDWETLADLSIQPDDAAVFFPIKSEMEKNPWLRKTHPDTPVYGMKLNLDTASKLGFDHLIDELTNAMSPQSGLPDSLRIQPKDLEKITVPQAVERVAKINKWRIENAKTMALQETLKADLYKAYPEQNFRWVQLNRPGQFVAESDAMGHSVRGYEPPEKGGSPYYGLGGWDAIQGGEAAVYSLRDKKGQPHVTIEVSKGRHPIGSTSRGNEFPLSITYGDYADSPVSIPEETKQQIYTLGKELHTQKGGSHMDRLQEAADQILGPMPGRITQIKGKANAAPESKYLPFVQDFVRSGNWSEVRDLLNANLIAIDRGSDLAAAMKAENATIPKYVTQDELNDLLKKYNAYGYKRGGKVRISNNPDTMRLELLRKKHA